jgi:hypothetical protein
VDQKPPSDPVFITSSDDDGNDDDASSEPISNMERLLLRALDYVDPRDLEL